MKAIAYFWPEDFIIDTCRSSILSNNIHFFVLRVLMLAYSLYTLLYANFNYGNWIEPKQAEK